METIQRIDETNYLVTLADKLKSGDIDLPVGLKEGMMGMALLFYHGTCKCKNEEWGQLADSLLEKAMEKGTETLSCQFESGLSGIGWGVEYLFRQEMVSGDVNIVLEDLDILFRKKLTLNIFSSEELMGMGTYFAEQAKLRSATPFSMEMRRTKRDMILCLDRMSLNWMIICKQGNWRLVLQYLSVLIDYYCFNVFRFRTLRLISYVLRLLQENKNEMGRLERIYAIRLLEKLYSLSSTDDLFREPLRKICDCLIETLDEKEKELIALSSPCILLSNEQYFLMTEDLVFVSLN